MRVFAHVCVDLRIRYDPRKRSAPSTLRVVDAPLGRCPVTLEVEGSSPFTLAIWKSG